MANLATTATAAPTLTRRRRSAWSVVWRGLLVLLLILIVAVAALAIFMVRRPLATTSGTLQLAGLSAPVTVTRDHSGIPHISGATALDVYRAQGYVMAQDRLFEMDLFRLAGSGRLSERLSASLVDTDRFFRTLGLRRVAEKETAALPADIQANLQAFADGVNAFIASHQDSLPLEYTV